MVEPIEFANTFLTVLIAFAVAIVASLILLRQNGQRLWKIPLLIWLVTWFFVRLCIGLFLDGKLQLDTEDINIMVTGVGIQGAISIGFMEFLKLLDFVRHNPQRITYFKEWIIQHWIKWCIHV